MTVEFTDGVRIAKAAAVNGSENTAASRGTVVAKTAFFYRRRVMDRLPHTSSLCRRHRVQAGGIAAEALHRSDRRVGNEFIDENGASAGRGQS